MVCIEHFHYITAWKGKTDLISKLWGRSTEEKILFYSLINMIFLKVGSFSFECIIILLIYFIDCQKAPFTRKLVSFSKKYRVKSVRLAVMLGIP